MIDNEEYLTTVKLIPKQCKDCKFRYKEDENSWEWGVCEIYHEYNPGHPIYKPMDVMDNEKPCEYYKKDETK